MGGMVSSDVSNAAVSATYTTAAGRTAYTKTAEKTASAEETSKTSRTSVTRKKVGNPQLSEKAAKYYEQLKQKYSNMDFVLVSDDMKDYAQSQAASYANPSKTVVLINESKIEKMAEDENYRAQYEGIIANSASGLSQLKSQLAASGANVKGYGMKVNDGGTATFFAVLKKSNAAQKARLEKKAEKKAEEKKAEAKKAAKEAKEERLNKSRSAEDDTRIADSGDDGDTVTITASSIEELMQKIEDWNQMNLSDNVFTEEEQKVGRNIDYQC